MVRENQNQWERLRKWIAPASIEAYIENAQNSNMIPSQVRAKSVGTVSEELVSYMFKHPVFGVEKFKRHFTEMFPTISEKSFQTNVDKLVQIGILRKMYKTSVETYVGTGAYRGDRLVLIDKEPIDAGPLNFYLYEEETPEGNLLEIGDTFTAIKSSGDTPLVQLEETKWKINLSVFHFGRIASRHLEVTYPKIFGEIDRHNDPGTRGPVQHPSPV